MTKMENLIIERQYLTSELEMFQNPATTLLLLIIALIAIIWMFKAMWHRYCYTITGNCIIVITVLAISSVIYIYMDNYIEQRNLKQELTLVEEALTRDYKYNFAHE